MYMYYYKCISLLQMLFLISVKDRIVHKGKDYKIPGTMFAPLEGRERCGKKYSVNCECIRLEISKISPRVSKCYAQSFWITFRGDFVLLLSIAKPYVETWARKIDGLRKIWNVVKYLSHTHNLTLTHFSLQRTTNLIDKIWRHYLPHQFHSTIFFQLINCAN